jgi:hypothetical protein
MAILQIRDMDDRLYTALRGLARQEKRSVSREVIFILESFFKNPRRTGSSQTEAFLGLSGVFEGESAKSIMDHLRKARRNSHRFT